MAVSVAVMVIAPATIPYMLPTFIGQLSGAAIGGISAAAKGGNVGSGMLFGVVAGTVTGGAVGAMTEAGYGGFIAGKMARAAVGGAGVGAASGYAGGKGNIGDIIKGAALGAATAAIIAGAMGVLQGDPWLPQSGIGSESIGTGNIAPSSSASGASEASSPGTSAYIDKAAPDVSAQVSNSLMTDKTVQISTTVVKKESFVQTLMSKVYGLFEFADLAIDSIPAGQPITGGDPYTEMGAQAFVAMWQGIKRFINVIGDLPRN